MSVAPDFKVALLDALSARPALGAVRRLYSPPSEPAKLARSRDVIHLGATVEQAEEWVGLRSSRPSREEVFTVGVVILSYRSGDVERQVERRIWELREEVSETLRGDTSLGVAAVLAAHLSATTISTEPMERGFGGRGDLVVSCKARP